MSEDNLVTSRVAIGRREANRLILRTGCLAAMYGLTGCATRRRPTAGRPALQAELIREVQAGDPDIGQETMSVDMAPIERETEAAVLGPQKEKTALALGMLAAAAKYVGVSRTTAPDQVGEFLQLFGLDLRYSNGAYVPFCAAGVSFSACQAYCDLSPAIRIEQRSQGSIFRATLPTIAEYYFKPSPACATIVDDARRRKAWIKKSAAAPAVLRPGWLVFFDWYRDGKPHHVGIVRSANTTDIDTVEFNTTDTTAGSQGNGGAVCYRTRNWRDVLGFVRTY